jgi:hypothetical protein
MLLESVNQAGYVLNNPLKTQGIFQCSLIQNRIKHQIQEPW